MLSKDPNIVIFLADDLGWGDVGAFGAQHIETPNLDGLAERGRMFIDAHAASSVCTPSRYSLLTGLHPWRSPLQFGVLGGSDPSILEDVPTIAANLRDRGYAVGAFGKWHLGLNWTRIDGSVSRIESGESFSPQLEAAGRDIDYSQPFFAGPLDHGFEYFFGIAGSLDMPPYCYLQGDRVRDLPTLEKTPLITSQRPGPMSPDWDDERVDLDFTEEATDWIRGRPAEQPFFAYIASAAPHRPCVPPPFVRGKTGLGDRADSVLLVDWMVGQVLDALAESGRLDETIFVFTSDNGAPLIFPEDGDVVTHRPNGMWRGQKADLYEGGHRVPLIIQGPDVAAGTIDDEPVSLLDLLPTFAPGRGETDGRPLTLEPGEQRSARRILAASAFDGSLTIRRGDRKALLSTGSGGFSDPQGEPAAASSERGQLYDLSTDPVESVNLWPNHRDEVQRMWEEFRSQTGFGKQKGAIYDS